MQHTITIEDMQALAALIQRAPMSRFEAIGASDLLNRITAVLFPITQEEQTNNGDHQG